MGHLIKTKRLALRVPTLDDAEFIQREFAKWEIIKYLNKNIPWPYPDDGAEYFLKEMLLPKIKSGQSYGFIIELISDNGFIPIGTIAYEECDDEDTLLRGFWLALDYHGQGYMSEASIAANDWVFENTNIKAIKTDNALINTASSKIKVRQGWELVSEELEDRYNVGEAIAQRWLLTRARWKALKEV